MPDNRYFLDAPLVAGSQVVLQEGEFHHLCTVMRRRCGDTVELINGRSCLALAKVQHLGKHAAELLIESVSSVQARRGVILAQGIPRLSRLEFILEKGTELGAAEFWLFPAERGERSVFSANQQARMRQILITAIKQCGRLDLPALLFKPPLKEWAPCGERGFFGDTRAEAPYLWHLWGAEEGPALMCIGPSQGFSPQEVATLEGPLRMQGVRLHDNILRADTASLVALSLMHS